MRRWISSVRPVCFPRAASRGLLSCVARGSIPYSAVTQPSPVRCRKGGTFASTEAVTRTCVRPCVMRHEPSACDTAIADDRDLPEVERAAAVGAFGG